MIVIFFRNIYIPQSSLELILNDPNKYSFSLRHGTNIVGGNYILKESNINWNIYEKQEQPEWSYPFSVDGHIYSKRIIDRLINKIIFKNPNTLEAHLCLLYKRKKNIVICFFKQIKLPFWF